MDALLSLSQLRVSEERIVFDAVIFWARSQVSADGLFQLHIDDFKTLINKISFKVVNDLDQTSKEITQTLAFWAAAPKGRCPVEHRGEFRDVRPTVYLEGALDS